jgi:glycosyltransferase involved in cell wall biosynthesis
MPKMNPLVSVIIPNYNYANFLGDAIQSVLNQTYKNFEIFVVDNESSDNSVSVALKFENQITVVRKPHGGVSSARNLGLSLAKGSYICFLDSDDTWVEDKLEKQLKRALTTQAEIVYSGINLCDEHLKIQGVQFPEYRGNCHNYYLQNPTKAIILLGCSNALIKKDQIDQVGGFREYLHHSADWDFFRRLSSVSRVEYVGAPQVNYRRHQRSMSSESMSNFYKN